MKSRPYRSKLIQLAQIGSRKVFPNDAERTKWKRDKTGKTSFADMSTEQLSAVVGELRRKGALHSGPPKRAGRVPFNRSEQMRKIGALLADMRLSWQYAESIAWRCTGGRGLKPNSSPGVERLEWVREEHHFVCIIAALHKEQKKRRLMAEVIELLKRLDLDIDAVDAWVTEAKRGTKWQRDVDSLKEVIDHLRRLSAVRDDDGADA